ncbi:FAD-binding oxidoreductase [Pseudooceanicola sp. CBS1P-1]|uniref:FAD-dependent oxidoreductase n=1 Tax=Pseudooceanicola albus TaxID=2692189 RepID=A0A6L7FW27_9RHOB|nr:MULTISPECIES: FAD-binding oxidoreductase [Pseudooceanicola]MBT9383363.1 FAD-binding oxidoreductase [Pseudooceanicola endophyticus]MXN16314.1 FAD-dependent oxidoreductase [Pseudooceanicola albus]
MTSVPQPSFWDLDVPDYRPRPVPDPRRCDVAVIGAGFSGLATALFLARLGRQVTVFEAGRIGGGASSRNGGMVGPSFHKLGMAGLTRAYGAEAAQGLMAAGMQALDGFEALVREEGLECDLRLTGRVRGARSAGDLRAMLAECARLKAQVGLPFEALSQAEIRDHVGSDAYVGGVLYPRDGGVHPKKLVRALAERAEAAGAMLLDGCPVTRLRPAPQGHRLETPRGPVLAREVVIASNGYSDARLPTMNARVVPIRVTVAATRALPPAQIRAMSPGLRMHGESGRVFLWSRPTPDGQRFLFGGRMSSPARSADRQRRDVAARVGRLFPALGPQDFEHVWYGQIAYTRDHAPHLNRIDGIWHVGGYCGSGVTRSIHFAGKLARKIAGVPGGDLPFDRLPFPKVPFRPLAPTVARLMTGYYGWLDERDLRRTGR